MLRLSWMGSVDHVWYTDVPYSARHDWPNPFMETVTTVLFPTITGWLKVCGVSDTTAGIFRCDRY